MSCFWENEKQAVFPDNVGQPSGQACNPKQSREHEISASPGNYSGNIQLLVTPNTDCLWSQSLCDLQSCFSGPGLRAPFCDCRAGNYGDNKDMLKTSEDRWKWKQVDGFSVFCLTNQRKKTTEFIYIFWVQNGDTKCKYNTRLKLLLYSTPSEVLVWWLHSFRNPLHPHLFWCWKNQGT